MKVNYDNLTHKEQCIINAQTNLDTNKKHFYKVKEEELIGGRSACWTVGTGTKKINEAWIFYWSAEQVYNAVLEALKVTEAQAQALTDAYNRYWENHA